MQPEKMALAHSFLAHSFIERKANHVETFPSQFFDSYQRTPSSVFGVDVMLTTLLVIVETVSSGRI